MSNSVRPHRRQPIRLPRPWDSPGKNTGVGCHFLLQCMKVKSESEVAQSCPILATPWTAAYQAPPSMGFSRQKYWSGVPLPSPNEHHINVSYYTHLDVYNTTCDYHILSLLLPGWINKNYNFLKGMFSVFLWCILAVLQEKEKKNSLGRLSSPLLPSGLALPFAGPSEKWKCGASCSKLRIPRWQQHKSTEPL